MPLRQRGLRRGGQRIRCCVALETVVRNLLQAQLLRTTSARACRAVGCLCTHSAASLLWPNRPLAVVHIPPVPIACCAVRNVVC